MALLLLLACEPREVKLERLRSEEAAARADLDRWRARAFAAYRPDLDSTDLVNVEAATDSAKAALDRLELVERRIRRLSK